MSAIRGQSAELLCASIMLERGWAWAWPTDGQAYDGLVCFNADDPNTWWRVQVKRIFMWNGVTPAVNVRRGDGQRYKAGDADYLAAVDVDAGLVYLYPWDAEINRVKLYRKKRLVINHKKHAPFIVGG